MMTAPATGTAGEGAMAATTTMTTKRMMTSCAPPEGGA
jgi:hypothetical protein